MATTEEDFKHRFAVLFKDLQADGMKDQETMFLIGSMATRIADSIGQKTWTGTKAKLSQEGFLKLLGELEADRKRLTADGQRKPAYAVQTLAMSLVANTHADPALQAGNALVNKIIDTAVLAVRKSQNHQSKWG